MSLFASPVRSQSGSLFAPVKAVNLACNTGNSAAQTHTDLTIVQNGLGRKPKSRKRTRKQKKRTGRKVPKGKKTKQRRRTMNRKRKNHKHKSTRKHKRTSKRIRRVNQVGRGTTYTNVLENTPNMGPYAARSDTALVNLQ
jgi:hypothetical protein